MRPYERNYHYALLVWYMIKAHDSLQLDYYNFFFIDRLLQFSTTCAKATLLWFYSLLQTNVLKILQKKQRRLLLQVRCHMRSAQPKLKLVTGKRSPVPSFLWVSVDYIWKEYVLLCKGNFLQKYSFLFIIIMKYNLFAYALDNLCICKYNETTVVWTSPENAWFGEFEK